MAKVECPCCNKGVQARHTYMVAMPATIVCTGCGASFRIDVANSGGLLLLALLVGTLVLAWFWPMALVLLPLYMVIPTGTLQGFTVELVDAPHTKLWTVNRDTGELERLSINQETGRNLGGALGQSELKNTSTLSKKLGHFRALEASRYKVQMSDTMLTPGGAATLSEPRMNRDNKAEGAAPPSIH